MQVGEAAQEEAEKEAEKEAEENKENKSETEENEENKSDDAGGGKGRDADEGRAHPSGDVFGLSPLLRSNRFSPHVAARILDNRLCPFVPIVPCMFFSFAVF